MRKTKLQIIDETVAYYSEDVNRRAIAEEECVYFTEDNRSCALGRCLDPSNPIVIKDIIGGKYNTSTGSYSLNDALGLDNILKEEYKGHPAQFWADIQGLHDFEGYWNTEAGLTIRGEDKVKRLKEEWMDK